ncbi:hypothetical protein ISCGN_016760 [Ixodes scapularis]
MGRSKAKQSHKTKRASKKNDTKENKHAESSVQELLSMVESAMDELQFDQARQLGERALRLEPDNLKTLDVLSGLLLEMGDVAGASQLLQRMIELEPNDGFRKYLSMGQLCDGKESLRHYSKGVEILQRLLGERQGASAEAVRYRIRRPGPQGDGAPHVEDMQLLQVIEAYCYSTTRTRHTVNSALLDCPQVIVAEDEKIIVEDTRGKVPVLEERSLVDTVYALRDQVKELRNETSQLTRALDEERQARHRLEALLRQHLLLGACDQSLVISEA